MASRIIQILSIVFIILLMIISFHVLFLRANKAVAIIYTTDIQGFITPHDCSAIWPEFKRGVLTGGSAYLSTYIKREKVLAKRRNRSFFLVDTGNFFSGQAEGYFLKGTSMIEIMNVLGYDAMAIGPKDFAFGQENIRNLAKIANFPFLSANIVKEDTDKNVDYIHPYIIKEYEGLKIGVIGVTNPLIFSENIKGIKILDPILTAKKYVSLLKNARVNLIVILSNLGLEGDKRLAQEVQGINIIIGGNDRSGYRELWPFYIDSKNKTVIVETWEKLSFCYKLDLILDNKGKIIKFKPKWNYLLITKFRSDPDIQVIVQKYEEVVREKKKEVIGHIQIGLMKSKDKESTLGNWVADILRQKTKADIALVAGLQTDLRRGEVTLGDVYNILPIIDRLEVVGFNLAILEITGEQIKDILEVGVSYGLEKGEGILQVSGLKYSYDLKRKRWDRVVEVTVNGERLDLGKTYKVAVNGYLAAGLGGYYKIKDAKNRYDTGLMDFDVLVEYIKTHSPIIAPPLEGRITRIEE